MFVKERLRDKEKISKREAKIETDGEAGCLAECFYSCIDFRMRERGRQRRES